jgi:anti-anti-sigma regulatory factor
VAKAESVAPWLSRSRARARRATGRRRCSKVQLDLTCGADNDGLDVGGVLDLASAGRLHATLRRLDELYRPLNVSLAEVSFADSTGMEPLRASSLRLKASGQPGLRITATSSAVRLVLRYLPLESATEP